MRLTPIAIASITLVILATSAQAESTSKASNQPLAAPQYTCSIVPMPANPAANEIVACNVICSEESGPNVVGSPSQHEYHFGNIPYSQCQDKMQNERDNLNQTAIP